MTLNINLYYNTIQDPVYAQPINNFSIRSSLTSGMIDYTMQYLPIDLPKSFIISDLPDVSSP
jgi:hypothetical protein